MPAGLAVRLQHAFTPALRKSLGSQQHRELTSPCPVPCQSCHTVLGQALSFPLHFCTPFSGVSVWCGTKSGSWQFPAGSEPILLAGESRGEISPFLVAFLCPHTCCSALLVPLPSPWGMFVPQGERAGRLVTSARHLQGFEARPLNPTEGMTLYHGLGGCPLSPTETRFLGLQCFCVWKIQQCSPRAAPLPKRGAPQPVGEFPYPSFAQGTFRSPAANCLNKASAAWCWK